MFSLFCQKSYFRTNRLDLEQYRTTPSGTRHALSLLLCHLDLSYFYATEKHMHSSFHAGAGSILYAKRDRLTVRVGSRTPADSRNSQNSRTPADCVCEKIDNTTTSDDPNWLRGCKRSRQKPTLYSGSTRSHQEYVAQYVRPFMRCLTMLRHPSGQNQCRPWRLRSVNNNVETKTIYFREI